jgi:hypothetical protein
VVLLPPRLWPRPSPIFGSFSDVSEKRQPSHDLMGFATLSANAQSKRTPTSFATRPTTSLVTHSKVPTYRSPVRAVRPAPVAKTVKPLPRPSPLVRTLRYPLVSPPGDIVVTWAVWNTAATNRSATVVACVTANGANFK